MDKVYNFSAGPAMLPREVMLKAQKRTHELARPWHVSDGSLASQ